MKSTVALALALTTLGTALSACSLTGGDSVEQDCPYPDLDGRDLEPGTRHVVLLENDVVVGTLRVLDDGDWARIGRVVVAPVARGRGLAALLMDEAMALCGDREVRLDAQTGLTAFYEGYGFVVTGPEFDEDGVRHAPMGRPRRP